MNELRDTTRTTGSVYDLTRSASFMPSSFLISAGNH